MGEPNRSQQKWLVANSHPQHLHHHHNHNNHNTNNHRRRPRDVVNPHAPSGYHPRGRGEHARTPRRAKRNNQNNPTQRQQTNHQHNKPNITTSNTKITFSTTRASGIGAKMPAAHDKEDRSHNRQTLVDCRKMVGREKMEQVDPHTSARPRGGDMQAMQQCLLESCHPQSDAARVHRVCVGTFLPLRSWFST